MNSQLGLDRRPLVCRLAAHGDGDRIRRPRMPLDLAPERSLNQRMDALARANRDPHPAGPAQARPEGRSPSIHSLLLDPPEYVETAKVFDMLLAVPKYGRVKVNKILAHCRIAPSKTIGGLSERQRSELHLAPAPLSACAPRGARRARALAVDAAVRRVWSVRHHGTLGGREGDADPRADGAPAGSSSCRCRRPRAPRGPGERDGVDYHFLTREEFDRRVAAGEFVEHADYAGRSYGTLRSELERRLRAGVPVVLEIEVQGARQVRAAMPEAVQVFIAPPSLDALRTRLTARGTDDPEEVERRLRVAEQELAAQPEFAHVVVNDRLDEALSQLTAIVPGALARADTGDELPAQGGEAEGDYTGAPTRKGKQP